MDTAPLSREEKALAFVDREGVGLEVGPSHNPIAPKREGFRVHILDHLSADELRRKYEGHNVELSRIEEVDFVWNGERLPDLIGKKHYYDWVIASHVIEHIPDPISFLVGCEELLKPTGVLSLVVPDKRYCFDRLRPLSSTGELLDAFLQRRSRPTPGVIFDHLAHAVKRGDAIAWAAGDGRPLRFVHRFEEAAEAWERAQRTEEYADVHVWRFIPESFRLIVTDLRRLGLIRFAITGEVGTAGSEFHVALSSRARSDDPDERLGWLELIESGGQAHPTENSDLSIRSAAGIMELSDRERRLIVAKRRMVGALRRTAFRMPDRR